MCKLIFFLFYLGVSCIPTAMFSCLLYYQPQERGKKVMFCLPPTKGKLFFKAILCIFNNYSLYTISPNINAKYSASSSMPSFLASIRIFSVLSDTLSSSTKPQSFNCTKTRGEFLL